MLKLLVKLELLFTWLLLRRFSVLVPEALVAGVAASAIASVLLPMKRNATQNYRKHRD